MNRTSLIRIPWTVLAGALILFGTVGCASQLSAAPAAAPTRVWPATDCAASRPQWLRDRPLGRCA